MIIVLLYYSKIVVGDIEAALYKISVLIDPLSETAQKWSTMLEVSNMEMLSFYYVKKFYLSRSILRYYRKLMELLLSYILIQR